MEKTLSFIVALAVPFVVLGLAKIFLGIDSSSGELWRNTLMRAGVFGFVMLLVACAYREDSGFVLFMGVLGVTLAMVLVSALTMKGAYAPAKARDAAAQTIETVTLSAHRDESGTPKADSGCGREKKDLGQPAK